MLWDQGHREGTLCARERTWYLPSLLQLCWGHSHVTGPAQHPLYQAAMTLVGNKVKNRDQHLEGALSGQAFPLRKRATKDAVSKDPNNLVWIRVPLAATRSVKLSPGIREKYWQERSSIIPLWQQGAAAELCRHAATQPHHHPGAITTGSCLLGN